MFLRVFTLYHRPAKTTDEFQCLGKFSEIHRYFYHKYTKKQIGHHPDFYERFMHFLGFLLGILNKEESRVQLPSKAKVYKSLFTDLKNKKVIREEVLDYIHQVAKKAQLAQANSRKDTLFYQRFLARMLLPAFNIYSEITDDEFNEIIAQIPGKMLWHEQETATKKEQFDTPVLSNLFYQLKYSSCPTIIDRCIKMMSYFPPEAEQYYRDSINILKHLQGVSQAIQNQLPMVSPVKNEVMEKLIIKMLLESKRATDQAKARNSRPTPTTALQAVSMHGTRRNSTGSLRIEKANFFMGNDK